jgi:hypothetical protein
MTTKHAAVEAADLAISHRAHNIKVSILPAGRETSMIRGMPGAAVQ